MSTSPAMRQGSSSEGGAEAAPAGWAGAASAGRMWASAPTGRAVEIGAPGAEVDSAGRARPSGRAGGAAEVGGAKAPLPADWGMEMGAPETPFPAGDAGAAPVARGAVKSVSYTHL
ncbi:hypothetical protein, partial [Flavonifractor plautii]|uniref:hypothetical protein n=1 Tax=Flavonifractor plautii TaxID=292800 RepID=UPI001FAEE56B